MTGNGQSPRENRNSGIQDTGENRSKAEHMETDSQRSKGKTELKYTRQGRQRDTGATHRGGGR